MWDEGVAGSGDDWAGSGAAAGISMSSIACCISIGQSSDLQYKSIRGPVWGDCEMNGRPTRRKAEGKETDEGRIQTYRPLSTDPGCPSTQLRTLSSEVKFAEVQVSHVIQMDKRGIW
jgi:hypothetical protein